MPVVKDGFVYISATLIAGIVFLFIFNPLGMFILLLSLFFIYFFRDPQRKINRDASTVLSPCDGTVLEVSEESGHKIVRVFLSVFNVHLQRSPVEGSVKSVVYTPGKFLPADNPSAHLLNENNIITIESPKGNFIVKQIAGILARRVVSWVKAGDRIEQGQKIGFIKFGSQVDLFMPVGAKIDVKLGDKVYGGKTIIGRI